ncbi:MAG: hypothetical protein JNL82_05565 [Myxococcales bacterium]|nr:hypothetical protein [Myxococcales bacterium]
MTSGSEAEPAPASRAGPPVKGSPLPRWCGRLAFTRDVWSGRARVFADAEIEATLASGQALPGPAAALLMEALPERGGQAWLLAHELGGKRRGAYGFDEFEAVLADSPWEVAVVDLQRLFVDAASLSRFAARARGRLENRLETRAFRLLAAIGEGAAAGRMAIVSSPAATRGGLGLADFQDLVAQHFARARVYALATVPVAVVVDCGEVVRDEEDVGDEDEDGGEPSLGFDNRLGDDLRYDTYVALVGVADAPLGVTLVELPAAPEAVTQAAAAGKVEGGRRDGEVEDLKIQLAQARRQVELAAIARQSLVTQLDAAQTRVDALEDQVAEFNRRVAEAPPGAMPAAPAEDPRPDATQAAVLALRWELEQVREELRAALGRPVEALEREVAELRARLAGG